MRLALPAGHPLATGVDDMTNGEPGTITLSSGHEPLLSADDAASLPQNGVLLDARAGERYRGETEPLVSVDRAVGVYCGSGVTAAHDALALTIAGFRPALFAGSWSAWSNQPERPIATGANP